jgi:hypothetical protein
MTPEEIRILNGNLTPTERENLRQMEEWTTCLQSWLDSARPSVIRERLAQPKKTFLEWVDKKALDLMFATMSGTEEIEALKQLFPMWEDELAHLPGDQEDAEIEKERELELTPAERKLVLLNHP